MKKNLLQLRFSCGLVTHETSTCPSLPHMHPDDYTPSQSSVSLPPQLSKCYHMARFGKITFYYLKLYHKLHFVSRPKPVLQSLEHDRHVNIKFNSILTRTN